MINHGCLLVLLIIFSWVILWMLRCVNKNRLIETSFLKELIVEAMPLWEDWISTKKSKEEPPASIQPLLQHQWGMCPSRSKKEISEEVMQRRVTWFDNIHPEGTFDDFSQAHGWFSLSPDKNTLLVVAFMCGFWLICIFLQLSQCHFLNISEGQRSLNNASKDLPCVWCIHSSSSRIDWQRWEPHNSCQWWLLQRTNWYRHQSNSHSRSFGFSLIALFLVYLLSGSLFFWYGPGMVWVQRATIFDGIAERFFFRKEIPRGACSAEESGMASSDVSSPSTASTRSPSTTSPVTPGAAEPVVAPSVPEGWGGAMEE